MIWLTYITAVSNVALKGKVSFDQNRSTITSKGKGMANGIHIPWKKD